jgi:hypothetical protein
VLTTKTTSTKAVPKPETQKIIITAKAVATQNIVNKKPLKNPSLQRVSEMKSKVVPLRVQQKTITKPNALVIKDIIPAKRISSQNPNKPVSRTSTKSFQKVISRNTVSSYTLKSSKITTPSLETKFIQKPINRKTFNEVTTRMENYAQVYAQRKENLLQKLSENDKNHRVFRSNPVPKSRPTGAITPKPKHVVKNLPHQIRHAAKELKVSTNQPKSRADHSQPKKTEITATCTHQFVATKPKVLQIAPFKPKLHQKPHLIKMEPFNLKVTDRVSKRKEFDDVVKKEQAEKKKQVTKGLLVTFLRNFVNLVFFLFLLFFRKTSLHTDCWWRVRNCCANKQNSRPNQTHSKNQQSLCNGLCSGQIDNEFLHFYYK